MTSSRRPERSRGASSSSTGAAARIGPEPARDAGFDRHLVKPLGVDELEALVHEQELRRAADRARESLASAPLRRASRQNQDET